MTENPENQEYINTFSNQEESFTDYSFVGDDEVDAVDFSEHLYDDVDDAEVLNLSSYDGNSNVPASGGDWGVSAEYHTVNVVETTKRSKVLAKDFVSKVSKILMKLDETKTPEMTSYMKTFSEINVNKISDLAFMVDSNRQLIENVIHRINSTNGEDFVTFKLYSELVNTHLKLQKELQLSYNELPSMFKRAKAEMLTDEQQFGMSADSNILVDEESNEFRTQKDLIASLRAEKARKIGTQLNT